MLNAKLLKNCTEKVYLFRKMKLIQRRAYGYRNFQNYRLRVLIECGHIVI